MSFEETVDGVGGEGTDTTPVGDPGVVDGEAGQVFCGVVGTDGFEEAATAWTALVGDHKAVEGAFLGPSAGKTNMDSHRGFLVSGRGPGVRTQGDRTVRATGCVVKGRLQTRWLDAGGDLVEKSAFMAEHERFARAAQALARSLARLGRDRARTGDVTPQQAETLLLVAERGVCSTAALALTLGIDPSTASRNLSALERAGYLTRRKGTEDGRQTDVRLTPRGKRVADTVAETTLEALAGVLDAVPRPERTRVVDALELLARLFDR